MSIANKKPTKYIELNAKNNLFDIVDMKVKSDHTGCTIFVPHVCNNVDLFGAGFAAQVAERYPAVKTNYHLLGKTFLRNNMGHCQIIKVYEEPKYKHKLYFANMIAQNGLPNNKNARPLNYLGLVRAMVNLSVHIKSNTGFSQKNERIEIHAPKFGSGLGGGNWNFISDLIEDIWGDYDVFIYNYSKR